eukprot:2706807-Rhodomonas_salina.1
MVREVVAHWQRCPTSTYLRFRRSRAAQSLKPRWTPQLVEADSESAPLATDLQGVGIPTAKLPQLVQLPTTHRQAGA